MKGTLVGGGATNQPQPTQQELLTEVGHLRKKLEDLERIHVFLHPAANPVTRAATIPRPAPITDPREQIDLEITQVDLETVGLPTTGEDDPEEDELRTGLRKRRRSVELAALLAPRKNCKLAHERSARLSLTALAPISSSTAIVTASLELVGWLHRAVHVPTFLDHHARWFEAVSSGAVDVEGYEGDFLALYFAVLATGLYFFDDKMCEGLHVAPGASFRVSRVFGFSDPLFRFVQLIVQLLASAISTRRWRHLTCASSSILVYRPPDHTASSTGIGLHVNTFYLLYPGNLCPCSGARQVFTVAPRLRR